TVLRALRAVPGGRLATRLAHAWMAHTTGCRDADRRSRLASDELGPVRRIDPPGARPGRHAVPRNADLDRPSAAERRPTGQAGVRQQSVAQRLQPARVR